jgi:hypothetical protein
MEGANQSLGNQHNTELRRSRPVLACFPLKSQGALRTLGRSAQVQAILPKLGQRGREVGMKTILVGFAALAIGAALSAPVQAQGGFNFGFRFGDQMTDFYPQRAICLTDRQIREAIARRGYTDIALNVPNDRRIEVRAVQDGWVYLIDFDFCANRVRGVRALRPAG